MSMVKTLKQIGNSYGVSIDKPILEISKITPETPLEITTDGNEPADQTRSSKEADSGRKPGCGEQATRVHAEEACQVRTRPAKGASSSPLTTWPPFTQIERFPYQVMLDAAAKTIGKNQIAATLRSLAAPSTERG